MKVEYDKLSRKIEEAGQKSFPCDLSADFAVFSDIQRTNHPSIIKSSIFARLYLKKRKLMMNVCQILCMYLERSDQIIHIATKLAQ